MTVNVILLILMILMALWAVTAGRIIKAAIGLALTSAILAIIMFRLASPMAAVFELSVCAGLISVIFFVTISFTRRLSNESVEEARKAKFLKFWYLPFILIIAGIALWLNPKPLDILPPTITQTADVSSMLWNIRHFDMFGQVVILLAGAFGVAVLFKGSREC